MNTNYKIRIAWLLPAMGKGGISFQHLLYEFTRKFPQTVVFTGQWPGFANGFENSFQVQEVGTTKHIQLGWAISGYRSTVSLMSLGIIDRLLKFKPQVIFTNAFSMWTAIVLFLKPLLRWKIIIICEGVSPSNDYCHSPLRLFARRLMVYLADAFVANGQAAKVYLVNVLHASEHRVFAEPFLVPSLPALLQNLSDGSQHKITQAETPLPHPVFLFVGQLIPRKGLKVLLEACSLLITQGYQNYTLLIVGDGEQRQELEDFAERCGLKNQVKWIGRVEYGSLGQYFQLADIFVFPTYEDIWGMVLTEAMAFAKPVITSSGAMAGEMVVEEQNGFIFEPGQAEQLAYFMRRFLDNPKLIQMMGEHSSQIMSHHTPEAAVASFIEALNFA